MLIASITGSVTDQITSLIGNHGVEAVFGLTALAAILPTGGELVMLYAGRARGRRLHPVGGGLRPPRQLAAVGVPDGCRRGHRRRHARLASRLGDRRSTAAGRCSSATGAGSISRTNASNGPSAGSSASATMAVPLGRITPFARSLISVPAGVFRVRFTFFAVLTTLASIVWCFGFGSIGFALGTNWRRGRAKLPLRRHRGHPPDRRLRRLDHSSPLALG